MKKVLIIALWAQVAFCWLINLPAQVAPPPCGTTLATYRGVPAKSNEGKYLKSCAGDAPADMGTYGWQYQCVEYVKRFYAEALSVNTKDWFGNGFDYFDSAAKKGLIAFENDGLIPPAPDDIIVFDCGDDIGHVAVVTNVSANSIICIEQNWSWSGLVTLGLSNNNGSYSVADRFTSKGKRYHVLGWLRMPPKDVVIQPGPTTGKDIWTTSVYSYAPGGSFPGGGLNNDVLRVGGWGDQYYSLLQFDLTGQPATASSAILHLYCRSQSGGGTPMYLDRIAQAWDWRTQGTGRDRDRLWWADRPAVTQWFAGQIPNPTQNQWYLVDITDLYNAWQNGTYLNYGLQFRPVNSFNNNFNEFYSADYADDPALRPKLVIQR